MVVGLRFSQYTTAHLGIVATILVLVRVIAWPSFSRHIACKTWCHAPSLSDWNEKCKWGPCSGCHECLGEWCARAANGSGVRSPKPRGCFFIPRPRYFRVELSYVVSYGLGHEFRFSGLLLHVYSVCSLCSRDIFHSIKWLHSLPTEKSLQIPDLIF